MATEHLNDRESDVRRTDQLITRVIELWPFWLTLAGGIVGAINFYNKVNSLDAEQIAWKATSDARREKTRDELEAIRGRITSLEKDVEWLKHESDQTMDHRKGG